MMSTTLNGVCSTCDGTIDYDGTTDNYIMCDGYCRRTFHLNCLDKTIPDTFWKQFRKRNVFLFFCNHCRELQKSFVMRKNFLEAERNVAELIEILQTATRDVDSMCRGAVESVNAAVSSLKTKSKIKTSETSFVDLVSPKIRPKTRHRKKKTDKETPHSVVTPIVTVTAGGSSPQTSTPNDKDEFLTPLPPSPKKKKQTSKGFFGTAGAAIQLSAAAERKVFVISRVHPSSTPDGIVDFIRQNTGIEDVRCQLMLPRGRSLSDLDYVSFKISATEVDYNELMKPEIWPAKVLVRDFERTNRRRGGETGFHQF